MAHPTQALAVKEIAGYGLGQFAYEIYFTLTTTYLLFFYTDIFGITAAVAGSVLLVARMIDAITDPILGIIADNTRTRWGRFRPYLLFGPAALGIAAVLLFTTPEFSAAGKRLYAYATYILFSLALTIVFVPHAALMSAMTSHYQVRLSLAASKASWGVIGLFVASAFTLPMAQAFADTTRGWQVAVALLAGMATLAYWLTFATTRERLEHERQAAASVPERLRMLLVNKPLLLLEISGTVAFIGVTMYVGAELFYFKYNLQREDLVEWYLATTVIFLLLGALITKPVAMRMGKRRTASMACGLVVATMLALYVVPYTTVVPIFVLMYVNSIGLGIILVVKPAMLADTVEYGEWKTGVRSEGLIFAVDGLTIKTGQALGGFLSGLVLAWSGYIPDGMQTEQTLHGIRCMLTLAPAISIGFFMVVLYFYPLDDPNVIHVQQELAGRRPVFPKSPEERAG